MGKLDGAVAIVTGAARGQGEAISRLFVDEGAKVVLSDILDQQGGAVAKDLGSSAIYTHLDVTVPSDWETATKLAIERFGKITVLVNNAGVWLHGSIEETPLEEYQRVITTNQVGCWLGMKYVAPHMRAAGGGSIINTSSTAGLRAIGGMSAYVSSKFAIRGMSQVAALELGASNIRVNSVYPGAIDTAMLPEGRNYARQPISRVGQPDEIAKMVLFLASEDASYCTGSEFLVDGGRLAGFGSFSAV